MISAKNIYGSKAYKQLKAYANGDKALLKRLVQSYVDNYNMYSSTKFSNQRTLVDSFIWHVTKQGGAYWECIHNNTRVWAG